jgi:hypothetical protein
MTRGERTLQSAAAGGRPAAGVNLADIEGEPEAEIVTRGVGHSKSKLRQEVQIWSQRDCDDNFRGQSISASQDVPNLQLVAGTCDHDGLNDCITSVRVIALR